VESDPLLSAQILEVANSAAFARLRHIDSLRHAIAMIGVGTMRKFALARSISNLFSRRRFAPNFSLTRFNLHSVATGTFLEVLAEEVPLESAENAFLAGLFHDVGKLLIAVSMPKQYEDILGVAAVSGGPLVECERGVIGLDHAELSALAVDYWGLAGEIGGAVGHHHNPESAPPSPPGKLSLSLAVNKADELVNLLGMGVSPPKLSFPGLPPLELPGFSFNQERLYQRFTDEWKSASSLFR
jgi:HD-like signal output (HDOD) protein